MYLPLDVKTNFWFSRRLYYMNLSRKIRKPTVSRVKRAHDNYITTNFVFISASALLLHENQQLEEEISKFLDC